MKFFKKKEGPIFSNKDINDYIDKDRLNLIYINGTIDRNAITEKANPKHFFIKGNEGFIFTDNNLDLSEIPDIISVYIETGKNDDYESVVKKAKDKIAEMTKEVEETPKKLPENPEEYNKLLSEEKQELKKHISEHHEPIGMEDMAQVLAKLANDPDEVELIIITDKDYNYLFLFKNIDDFLDNVDELENGIDFSYLSLITEDDRLDFGYEYPAEVTMLFEDIQIMYYKTGLKSENELGKIKDIDIFVKIFTDYL